MELVNFQLNAIAELKKAMYDTNHEIIFKSPTGSGKTIMLTHFMNEFCKCEPNIVFVWLTPGNGNLEEQSRAKMDKYIHNAQTKFLSDVMTGGFVENDCCFINWELLIKEGNNAMKDGEYTNFKEHVEKALKNGLQFKIIIDESHHNDSPKSQEILSFFHADKIIRASATPNDFDFSLCTFIEVPEEDVIASGLIKKLIVINEDIRQDSTIQGTEESFLIDKALAKRDALVSAYGKQQSSVNPLIIVQLPNNNDVLLDSVEQHFESKNITYENGLLAVHLSDNNKKINLENISENNAKPIAIIIKQAIATGWDCPRAHILVKLRDNTNERFEIQTVGRIRRMPEAKHYNDDLLDNCYVYTFDSAFTMHTLLSNPKVKIRDLEVLLLYLKKQFSDFELTKETRMGVSTLKRVNTNDTLDAIVEFYKQKYSLEIQKYADNQRKMSAAGYIFSEMIQIITKQGQVYEPVQRELEKLNDLSVNIKLNTHDHGRLFHHDVSEIGLYIHLPYDQMALILRMLFQNGKFLNLDVRSFYSFVINNFFKLREDIFLAMSVTLKQKSLDVDEYSTQKWTMPRNCMFLYNSKSKNQSIREKNVYEGYLASAELRSSAEKKFEAFCENSDFVDWIYKNGDKGEEYFSIAFQDNAKKIKLFYPDYIVGTKDGVWIIETKGGFGKDGSSEDIDVFSPMKFSALKRYLSEHPICNKGVSLKGGFVREDKECYELCICTENYVDDIESEAWKFLKDVFALNYSNIAADSRSPYGKK